MNALLLIIFCIIFFTIAWYRRDHALLIITLLLPSYLVRFKVLSIPSTVLELMILLVFLAWLLKVIFDKSKSDSHKSLCKKIWFPWRWPILLFILVGVIAVIVSPDTRQALGLWRAYIVEPVLLFIVLVNTIKTKEQVRRIFLGAGISAVLVSVVTIWQYIGWIEIPGHYGLEIPKRATSVFPFPTAVGKYIGPLLGLFLGLVLVRNSKEESHALSKKDSFWKNIYLWGVILFSTIALVLSFSRGALIAIFITILFVSVFSKWKKWIWAGMVITLLIALAIPVTRNNITDVFNTSDTSTDVHIVMWKGAVRIIQDNPITGTGLASFPVVYDEYKEVSHTEYFPNPDHFILSIWIEMGIAGLIIFTWIIVRYFKAGIRLLKMNRKWSIALMAAMVTIIAHGFIDTPYFKNDLSVMFWIFIGLMVIINKIYSDQKSLENN